MTTLVLQPAESTALDTFIASTSGLTDRNYGIGSNLQGGRQTDPSGTYRTLLKFSLTAIPSNAFIASATLTLRCTGGENTNAQNFTVRLSFVQWYEGNENGAVPNPVIDSSTWNHRNYNGSVAWVGGAGGGSGSDFAITPSDTTTVSGFNADYNWDVTADVRNFYHGVQTNHGWWLLGDEGAVNGRKNFASSFGAFAPKLTIVYTVPTVSEQESVSLSETVTLYTPPTLAEQEAVQVGEALALILYNEGEVFFSDQDTVQVADTPSLITSEGLATAQETLSVTDAPTLAVQEATPRSVSTQDAVSLADTPVPLIQANLSTLSDSVQVAESVTVWTPEWVGQPRRYALPLLYLTDGQVEGGRLRKFNLLNRYGGYSLCDWEPILAQQKNGGLYTESALVDGRRLIQYAYENPVETLTLAANAVDQNRLIADTRDLFGWLERAAQYWTSRFATRPVYLVARSAYEEETRYAVIYNASVPKLQNPYGPEFYNRDRPFYNNVEVYLERGPWLDQPPDQDACVPISTNFTWNWSQSQLGTETGGGGGGGSPITDTVYALIEANNGVILAGVGANADVYSSTDDGRSWTLLTTLCPGPAFGTINAFTKDGSGNLYAAVSGLSPNGGVWRSTNNGSSWTQVFGGNVTTVDGRSLTGFQCYDILYAPSTGYFHAVGYGLDTSAKSRPAFADSQNGTTWNVTYTSFTQGTAIAVAMDRNTWPNVLVRSIITSNQAWVYYSPFDHITQGLSGTFYGPFGIGEYQSVGRKLVGWDSDLVSPQPSNIIAAVRNNATTTYMYKLFFSFGAYSYLAIGGTTINDLYHSLYVDPSSNNPTKRIYAGGNETVYKSENGGFNWTVLSTVPTGEVLCFLRTPTSMLAGGDDGIILLEGGDLPGGSEPPLPSSGATIQAQVEVGQTAVCSDPGVYVGNQRFRSSLTNILRYDAGTAGYTELYPMTEFPVELLPTVPAVNDAIYFGVQSNMAETDGGSLQFADFRAARFSDRA